MSLQEEEPRPSLTDACHVNASRFYTDMVPQKLEEAPTVLVSVLGELNLERYQRLADVRYENFGRPIEEPGTESVRAKSTLFHDSGLDISIPATSAAPSRASSLAFTLAGQSRNKLPPLPVAAKTGPFCQPGLKLGDVKI